MRMDEKESDVMKKIGNEGDVIMPSFRLGNTLSTSGSQARLTFDEAIYFGKAFEGNHEGNYFRFYREDVLKFLREFDPSVSLYEGGNKIPYVRYFQVPVINFPYFEFKYKGSKLLIRESLTTCIGYAKSKIWFSATLPLSDSNRIDTFSYLRIEELSEQLSQFGEKMLKRFKRFYFSTIERLLGKKMAADRDLEAKIFCFSTPKNIDENLKTLLQKGKREFLKILDHDTRRGANENAITNFLNWVSKRFEIEDKKDLDLKLITSLPRDDKNIFHAQRLSLVAQKRTGDSQETYFSLGYEPTPRQIPLRYNNSEVSSRTLVVEIGRVH